MVLWKTILDCRHSKMVFWKIVLEFSIFLKYVLRGFLVKTFLECHFSKTLFRNHNEKSSLFTMLPSKKVQNRLWMLWKTVVEQCFPSSVLTSHIQIPFDGLLELAIWLVHNSTESIVKFWLVTCIFYLMDYSNQPYDWFVIQPSWLSCLV